MPTYTVRMRNRETNEVVVVDVGARASFEAAALAKPRDPSVIVESVDVVEEFTTDPTAAHPSLGARSRTIADLSPRELRILIASGVMWGALRTLGILLLMSITVGIVLGIIVQAIQSE